jgi:hypothetical protein
MLYCTIHLLLYKQLPAVDEKIIVQLFGRHQRVPPPLGIPDSFES